MLSQKTEPNKFFDFSKLETGKEYIFHSDFDKTTLIKWLGFILNDEGKKQACLHIFLHHRFRASQFVNLDHVKFAVEYQ